MGGGGAGGGGPSSKFRRAAKKLFLRTCGSFRRRQPEHCGHSIATTVPCDSPNYSSPTENQKGSISFKKIPSEISRAGNSSLSPRNKVILLPFDVLPSSENLCAICLDPLNYSSSGSPGQAIFTAQCSHAFHFACISSNVRHGSITCPICRAQWTQLPRNLNIRGSIRSNKSDPVLQILDDSIAHSRFHRRSFLRSSRYDDDDPVDPDQTIDQPRLHFSLLRGPQSHHSCQHLCGASSYQSFSSSSIAGSPLAGHDFSPSLRSPNNRAYLRVEVAYQPATDLVLVVCPNGPHLRLMKQAMALVVFSLRPCDRLAIVTYSSSASRVFPLRRMTPFGKKTALQVIDHLFCIDLADPSEGLKKGVKILSERIHQNPHCCVLHLTNSPTRSHHLPSMETPITIHRFQLGFCFRSSNRLAMHEFEEFLARTLGGAICDIQIRIKESMRIIRIDELRGGEERCIPLCSDDHGPACVAYSYVDVGDGGEVRMGEVLVASGEKGDRSDHGDVASIGRRISSGERWEYHDTFMARRWAKHLHEHRL